MAERLEDFLRRVLEAQLGGPPGAPMRQPPPEEIAEAEVITEREGVERPSTTPRLGEITAEPSHQTLTFAEGAGAVLPTANEVSESLASVPPPAEHPLGRLNTPGPLTEAETGGQRPTQAALSSADVAQLLRSPQRLREAILLNEILKRPFDW